MPLSRDTEAEVYLKLENAQRTGSFNVCGDLNKLHRCREQIGPKAVVAASTGNLAQGVALARLTSERGLAHWPSRSIAPTIAVTERKGGGTMHHEIQWETDMETALKRAKAENKPVLLDFFNPG